MPVSVIVGGQFGSEGKGKVAHWLAADMKASVAIRTGGPNSGHTVIGPDGQPLIFRHLPTAAILPDVSCCIGAGSYILPELILGEIEQAKLPKERLRIDGNAVVISNADISDEKHGPLGDQIGSTASGTGAAVRKRIERTTDVQFARDHPRISEFVKPVVPFLREQLAKRRRLILEGTQGFGLSLYHSDHYPYVTSRDTSAASFLAEAGLSPLDVDDIVLVLRSYPIRVSGNSGPLADEINWGLVTKESGSREELEEYTSVTRKLRRVARFCPDVVKNAIKVNQPTRIVLNHLDYVDYSCHGKTELSGVVAAFVGRVEGMLGRRVSLLGTAPGVLFERDGGRASGDW